ncbi:antitoxin [Sphingomonas sp.]|uniref:antitoxin n=1 Tax=Sphingomonas sp. TaxID=28214 RepID=UPI0035BC1588
MNEMRPIRDHAKLFWTGRSQAVRLPKEFRFEGKEVLIHREGDRVILEPALDEDDDGAWVERLAGSMDDETARIILEERPGPETLPEWAHLR